MTFRSKISLHRIFLYFPDILEIPLKFNLEPPHYSNNNKGYNMENFTESFGGTRIFINQVIIGQVNLISFT